jgi:hypothetical protein
MPTPAENRDWKLVVERGQVGERAKTCSRSTFSDNAALCLLREHGPFQQSPFPRTAHVHEGNTLTIRMHRFRYLTFLILLALLGVMTSAAEPAAEDPILDGYATPAEFDQQIAAFKQLPGVKVTSLTKTLGKRDVWLLTLGHEAITHKPALLLVGNVEPGHLIGSEVLVRLAETWAKQADNPYTEADQKIKQLLEQVTIYIIPRPSPDATAKCWKTPVQLPEGNAAVTDDDRDGRGGEDPADDLNGDGRITQMRVIDSLGTHRPHPDDPRVLIEVNPKKNETAKFRLYPEGRDDDHDDAFNEDGGGGVAFNKNWTMRYQPFAPHAGPHQVSELETRAIADWCFEHQNIVAVFTFTPEDNLFHPWKPGTDAGKIRTTVTGDDAAPLEFLAEQYRDVLKAKDPPAAAKPRGSFSEWAYYHFGRWSLASRGWWIPQVAKAEEKKDEKPAPKKDEKEASKDTQKPVPASKEPAKDDKKSAEGIKESKGPETRGAEELNALRWMEREKIDGFTPWAGVVHPDLPQNLVSVGGFHPLVFLNPPAKEFDGLTSKHSEFLQQLIPLLPQLELREIKTEGARRGPLQDSAQGRQHRLPRHATRDGRHHAPVTALDVRMDDAGEHGVVVRSSARADRTDPRQVGEQGIRMARAFARRQTDDGQVLGPSPECWTLGYGFPVEVAPSGPLAPKPSIHSARRTTGRGLG